jgi:hypothetical protein
MNRAADDAEVIAKRISELKAESLRMLNCICRNSDDGSAIITSECPVHGIPKFVDPSMAFTADLGPSMKPIDNRRPEDDWQALKEQWQGCVGLDAEAASRWIAMAMWRAVWEADPRNPDVGCRYQSDASAKQQN